MPLYAESPAVGLGGSEIMLFGVRVNVDPMRKSVSMNNLSEYDPVSNTGNLSEKKAAPAKEGAVPPGYASADDAAPPPSSGGAERKRGTPWTEEEHKLFLIGLQKVGKGGWRRISRNYVKTRTPTQVASHAQKYFLRRSNLNRRRRASVFDITTDSVAAMAMEEARKCREISPMQGENPLKNGQDFLVDRSSLLIVNRAPVVSMPPSSAMADLKLNQQVPPEPSALSLRLSLSSSFINGDGTITVA